ncbi:adhesion G protein-coupled receptor L3-like [Dreissena polymorpha]|uniref:adhesion G protein-coupled receptor L3-like n=1 Tax=Dreissena polymorpha TaxID=45954 RepID=UPI0022653E19|nr:adhesion G protein-coupled receptor L3-like [Dreissena polymorpha]
MVVVTKNIAFEVKKVVEGYLSFPENYFQNYTNNDTTWILQSKSGIFLNTSKLGDVVATIVIYKNLTDVISARSKFNRSSNDDDVVNGPVMSCSISNVSSRLASPIILTFEHGQTNFINASCNYWKFSSPGYWSSDGCIVRASNDTITVCECDHLTNFAVLMSHFVEAHVKSNVLRLVSIVGLSLSTFCLLLTIIILAKLWRYVRSDRFVVLLNLILALIISYAIFIGGVNRTENKFNVIVLILLFKKMFSLKAMVDKQIKDKIKKTLWSLCVLVPLLGVSWILGIFYVNESASFMQYVFAVCNGLQGVYIFVFNCILNGQVKNGFKTERIRRKNKSMASSFSLNMSKDSTRERRDCDTPVKCASVPGRPSNQMEHITKRETSGNQ